MPSPSMPASSASSPTDSSTPDRAAAATAADTAEAGHAEAGHAAEALRREKKALRSRLRAARRERAAATPAADRARASQLLAEHTLAYLASLSPRPACVTAFESMPTEVPTEGLLLALREAGIDVIVPITQPDLSLHWARWLGPGVHGPTQGPDAVGQADVVLIPAMAVDTGGRRIGQGGGCYDRTLPRRRAGAPIVALVADAEYVSWALPVEPTDHPIEGVITPRTGYLPLPAQGA